MKVVIQRESNASVTVGTDYFKEIKHGLLILVGVEDSDNQEDIEWLANKIVGLRIFDDENGVMNRSVIDVDGEIMLISQFTLHARTKKGNRPSYVDAAKPEIAIPLYNNFKTRLEELLNKTIPTGIFGEYMQVSLTNDGPVTIIIDSKNRI